jgi:hypothetical protein
MPAFDLLCNQGELTSMRIAYNGRARATITVFDAHATSTDNLVILHMDTLNPAREADRAAFVARLPERTRAEVDEKLIHAALQLEYNRGLEQPNASEAPAQGGAIAFEEPEPSPRSVPTATLLDLLSGIFNRFVILPDGAPLALSLWAMMTYVLDEVSHLPKLALVSPVPRCGKTLVLDLLAHIVRRPLAASNVTPAVVFRVIQDHHPTLLIDEADTFLHGRDAMVGILNAGHTRASAFVLRAVGDTFEPRRFDVFTPQAIALIGRLPTAALADRCVTIPMRRKGAGDRVTRFDRQRHAELSEIRPMCLRWAQDHVEHLRSADPPLVQGLHDRANDNWRTLLAIAGAAGPAWRDQAREAAVALNGATDSLADGEILLNDLQRIFVESGAADGIPSAEILAKLLDMDERPWGTWNRGHPLTAHGLARLLRPFDVRPTTQRFGGGPASKGYQLADLRPVFERYLLDTSSVTVTSVTPVPHNDLHDDSSVTRAAPVTVAASRNSFDSNGVTDVTLSDGVVAVSADEILPDF